MGDISFTGAVVTEKEGFNTNVGIKIEAVTIIIAQELGGDVGLFGEVGIRSGAWSKTVFCAAGGIGIKLVTSLAIGWVSAF